MLITITRCAIYTFLAQLDIGEVADCSVEFGREHLLVSDVRMVLFLAVALVMGEQIISSNEVVGLLSTVCAHESLQNALLIGNILANLVSLGEVVDVISTEEVVLGNKPPISLENLAENTGLLSSQQFTEILVLLMMGNGVVKGKIQDAPQKSHIVSIGTQRMVGAENQCTVNPSCIGSSVLLFHHNQVSTSDLLDKTHSLFV